MTKSSSFTAAQEVLLAAAELDRSGRKEFSEWDLTVSAWKRNKNKFGSRGYESEHPDHKRVMMEIMSKNKRDNPLRQGWIEKTRANHYRMTSLGLAEAEKLSRVKGEVSETLRSGDKVYDSVVGYINHRAFRDYCRDPDEPRTWLGASAFLGLARHERVHLGDRINAAENAASSALEWLDQSGQDKFTRGPTGGGVTVRRSDLEKLRAFVGVLQERFHVQLDAIRRQDR